MSNMHGPRNFGPPRPNMMPPRGGRFGGPNFRGPRPGGFMPRGPNQGQGPPSRPPFGGGNFRPPPMNQGGQGMMGHDINRPPGPGMPPIRPGGPMFMGPPPGMGGPMRSGGPDGPMPMPCGSPLPIIDPSKEVWVETLSPDGKTYYYHAKTRETVWKRPAADNVQIIKQSEAHVLANPAAFGGFRPQLQSQQQPPQQQPQQQQLPQTVQQQQQPIQQQQPQQQQPQQHQPQQPSLQQHEHEPRMLLPSVDNTSVPLSSEVKETNNDVTMQNDEEPAIESPNSNAKSSVNQENNKDTDMEIEATESSANDDDDKSGKSPGNNEVSMNDAGSPQTQNSSALPLKIGADINAPPTDSMPPPNNVPQNSPPVQNNMTPQNNPSPPQQNNAPPQINSQPLNGSMPPQSNMPQHQNNNTGMQPMLPNNMQPPNNMPMQSNNMRPPMMNNGPPMQQPMRPMMMGPGPGGLGPMQRPMGPMMMGLPMVMPGMMGGFPPGMMLPGVPPMMRPPPTAAAAGKESWKEHKAPDGRTYYYNIHTMESRWTKPDEMDDDDAPPSAVEAKPEPVSEEKKEADAAAEKRAKEEEQAAKEKAAKEEQARNEKMSEEEKSRQQQRPVATKPVPGTPWCVVWTGDEKVFFFNPTTRLSMWERPEELKDRVDVDKILADPPHKRKLEEDKSQAAAATEEPAKKKLKESKKEESEAAAAKGEKAVVPYETRAAQFEEMLLERQVSAFSTWEKELHKIVFDERYSLISAKERKQVFDHFVKTRAENERKEKKAQILKAREDFKALLGEVNYSLKMGFSEFASRYAKEARFRAIDKMKDREAIFNDFVTEMKKRKEEDERNKVDKMKLDFFLLMEEKKVEKYSRWSRAKEKICQDARFTAIESHIQKEQWWDEYVSKHKQSAPNEDEKRKKRAEESIKAREEEVEREKAERRAEIDTERQRHRLDEAAQHFKALLVDMVRNPDVSWSDTKRQLKKDNRWDLASLLTRDDKERHFVTHIDTLNKRKRGSFKHLLEEIGEIKLTTKWKEAKKLIKHDPRYTKFSSSDRKREREFDEYIKAKMQQAKNDLQDLLRECKLITHKTRDTVKADSKHLKEIVSVLKNDKRYLVLDCAKYEREDMLKDYIEDLHRRGPPPPPTATEPNRRLPLMK